MTIYEALDELHFIAKTLEYVDKDTILMEIYNTINEYITIRKDDLK